MRKAEIKVNDKTAGWFTQDENGYHFQYDTVFLESSVAEPVSVTLPLQDKSFNSNVLFPFFDGLSPKKFLLTRSVIGGLVVSLSVLVAKTAGPVFGGIIAAFPAMFISILTISYKAQGIEFPKALTKPLMVTGMITVAVYAIAIIYLYLWS